MGYCSAFKKEILQSVIAQMDLEDVMLSEISGSQKDRNHCLISLKGGEKVKVTVFIAQVTSDSL